MPKLKEYVETSDKSGNYIVANVGGTNPVTLQLTDTAASILEKAGYSSEDDVPTKLVWSMYEVNLLYTQGCSSNTRQASQTDIEKFTHLIGSSKLTTEEKQRIIRLLDEYEGVHESRIRSLINQMLNTTPEMESSQNSPTNGSKANLIGANIDSIDSVLHNE